MVVTPQPRGLIDSDILIDARRGFADGVAFLTAQSSAGGITISIVSAMELIAGSRNATELAAVQRFIAGITCVPLSASSSLLARQWMEAFTLSHSLTIPDALIAASAAEQHLPLFTKNTRHFVILPGLNVIRPY